MSSHPVCSVSELSDGVLPIIVSIFYHCFLVLGVGRDPARIGLDHRCNRSRALAVRDRIVVGSAKAAWPISRCRSRATAARLLMRGAGFGRLVAAMALAKWA
jgi:hypothetical protein